MAGTGGTDRRGAFAPGIWAFAVSMAVLIFTAAPSIYHGDSPEFTTASHVLGVPHPPGYPHYVLLGKVAALLPFGSIAFRLNLLSAAGTSLAAALAAVLVYRRSGHLALSVLGALLLPFSRDLFAQSGSAEVYTLQAGMLLLALLIADSVAVDARCVPPGCRRAEALFAGSAFVLGAATGFHYTSVFCVPGILHPFVRRMGWRNAGRALPAAVLAAFAGWSLFLLMPLLAARNPPLNWGETFRPVNFLTHVFWSQYADRPGLDFSWLRTLERGGDFLVLLSRQWPWPLLVLLLPGGFLLGRTKPGGLFPAVALSAVVPAAATVLLLNDPSPEIFFGINSNKFLPAFAFIGLIIAAGPAGLLEALTRRFPPRDPATSRARGAAASLASLVLAAALFRGNLGVADRSGSLQLPAYVLNVVDPLPPGSALVTEHDVPAFPLLYLRFVEEYRPDLAVHPRLGILFGGEYNAAYEATGAIGQGRLRERIDRDLEGRFGPRLFFSNLVTPYAPGGARHEDVAPFGLAYRLRRPGGDAEGPPDLWGPRFLSSPFRVPPGSLDHRNRELVSDMHRAAAEAAFSRGDREAGGRSLAMSVDAAPDYYWTLYYGGMLALDGKKDPLEAEALLTRAFQVIPSEAPANALGIVRMGAGDVQGAEAFFLRALSLDPAYLPSLRNAAECRIALGDPPGAEAYLLRAVSADPQNPAIWVRLGTVQGGMGRYPDARESLGNAVRLSPADPEPMFLRGVASQGLGDPVSARADFLAALSLAPGDRRIREALSRLPPTDGTVPRQNR